MTRSQLARRQGERGAFSLLEVVLAMAILTVALAACLALVELGVRSAHEARAQTRAQELCESILGLITSGVLDLKSVQGGEQQSVSNIWSAAGIGSLSGDGDLDLQLEEDQWLCSIKSESSDVDTNLAKVTVTVTESTASAMPVQFTLVRWLLDPDYVRSLEQSATTTTAGAP